MLTRIKLKNSRAFREEIDVRIRPITILIGRNSAGKSTLIKFLLMLQQTLESSEAGFFVTEGRHATLGTFQDLKNSMSRSNSLQFTLEIETNDLPEPAIQQIREELQQSKPIENLEATSVDLNVNLRTSSTISTQDSLEQETSVRVSAEIPARELIAQFAIVGSIPYSKSPRGKHSVTCNIGGNKIFKKQVVAHQQLNPDHVSVAYFHTEDQVVNVKNLDIKPDGSLEKGLPMEFFGADIIEALEL